MTYRAAVLLLFLVPLLPAAAPPVAAWWPAEVERALGRAGANRGELRDALYRVPAAQRKGMAFLIANMPDRDLRSLRAGFLLENVALAYRARDEVRWGRDLPENVFLNDVLPYASMDEPRDPWRKSLRELCLPIVKDCKTPAEAAQKLNATIFGKLKVRYSTKRKRANQSPTESIELGLASCSGLSILLVGACRSVCVPARVVGTPLWANRTGNHTWVEVWDRRWMFTGAAEQDPNGMDRGWFVHNASQAKKDEPVHWIYAASFRRTGVVFPLVWDLKCRDVFAENVTDRYAAKAPDLKLVRVHVRVFEKGSKKRLPLPVLVEVRGERCEVCRGSTKGETADTNDTFTTDLPPGRDYVARVGAPVRAEVAFRTDGKEQFVDVEVPVAALGAEDRARLEKEARRYFEAKPDEQAKWKFDAKLEGLLAGNEAAVREAVWRAYRGASVHESVRKDAEKKEVRYRTHVSPYTVKRVGKKPAGGWPVFIAMHGGGGAPKEVNDSQWRVMQIYYRDQPTVPGYLYVALRAPNNTWNGFYDTYVPPLILTLVRQLSLSEDVDPDKVYLMGYSHGGYGAFYIGPRIPDRFAAVHVSAAAPSDGHHIARNLRHLRFTYMIGEKDTAYGRIERCKAFNAAVEKIKAENKGAYPVTMEYKAGLGHGGLPDRDKIKDMYPYRRDAAPRHVTWELLDGVIDHCYWVGVPKPDGGKMVEAKVENNKVTLTTRKVDRLELYLDTRLVRFDKPLRVSLNGKDREVKIAPSLAALCRSMAQRGDPQQACTCIVPLTVE